MMLCRACIPHVPVTRALAVPTLRLVHTVTLRHGLSLAHSPQSQTQRSSLTRDALRTRSFASSPHRRAEEDPNLQRVFDNQQKVLQFLQDKPEVLDYMKEFITLLKDNGIDVQSGQMPSKTDMFRLLMKTEVRESAMKMATAFQEAGIDLRSKDMMQSLLDMQKQFTKSK
ncbi:hypothetical protein C8Q74DRAFT_1266640 [Fomes fomentarius]|nr:hypothetical protein C8Q74DRAFT_1266640 [Fomes fomentarius]